MSGEPETEEPQCVCGHRLHPDTDFCDCGCSISQQDTTTKDEDEELKSFYRNNVQMGVLNSWGF